MSFSPENLIWIDLEMTGLDSRSDRILEIATVVTDKQLHPVATGPVLAIHQPDSVLAEMDRWNVEHHSASGLIERVRVSSIDAAEAERRTLQFLRRYVPERVSPMCGNSICQDRRFLARFMPVLEAFFHYRQIDVSTFKELAKRWAPQIVAGFGKKSAHEALADIEESIAELAYYRRQLFLPEYVGGED